MVEPTGGSAAAVADYPAAWEADVVLHDGTTTRVRPLRRSDADALQAFHVAQSERSTYFRFFHPLLRLPPRDLEHLIAVDHRDRVALVAVEGAAEKIIGVARYDRIDPDTAEVAFNVADAHQGRGLGSVLLEHLAAAARERGVRRFVAEVLPANGRMLAVFRDAGYEVRQRTEEGVVAVSFEIDPTDRSVEVMADREHTAEARSMRALFEARSVLVVGPGAGGRPLNTAIAERVVRSLGPEAAAGRVTLHTVGVGGETPGAMPWHALTDVPGPVDVAALAGEAEEVVAAVGALARLGVRTVVVLSGGFAEEGSEGLERQRRLLRAAHGAGMRLVGPSSYGVVATGPDRVLDLSLAGHLPGAGPVGLFCQSAPFAVPLLSALERRGLGLSQFLSAGHRADVSGNDLMQFWADDEQTAAVGLHLESIGNPRKFSRVARRLAARKPVVVMTAGAGAVVPPGHAVRATRAPSRAFGEMLRQSGVVRVENTHQLVDVLQLVTSQPLPAGRRVGILSSSQSVGALVAALLRTQGLEAEGVEVVVEDAPPERLREAVSAVYDDPDVDAVVAVSTPVLGGTNLEMAHAVAGAAAMSGRPTVAVMTGLHGLTPDLTAADGTGAEHTVPAYSTSADAALALGLTVGYAVWRAADRGRPLHPSGVDLRAARRLAEERLASGEPAELDPGATAALLATVGIRVLPSLAAADADEAAAAAASLGYPVALKTTVPALRHRADLGGVRLDVADEPGLRVATAQVLAAAAGYDRGPAPAPLEVQAMAAKGIACVLRSSEDPLFGPVVAFGVGGDATELLDDVAYGVPPLTDADVAALVHEPRAAVRLLGYRGLPAADVAAVEDLVGRVAVLADGLPELRSLELNPVVAAPGGVAVLGARATLGPADRTDATRRLSRT